jgi:hypothetical protein
MSFSYAPSNARPAPIDDRLLAQLAQIAHDAPKSLASEAECEWLLSTIGPLLDELQSRRTAMARTDATLAMAKFGHPNIVSLSHRGQPRAR